MKSVVFGARRSAQASRDGPSLLDAALAPALSDGRWCVPSRFNFTRDVVEVLARDTKRQALTFVGRDGIIEPRTFVHLAHGAARWASYLREHGVVPGDRVLVSVGASPDWLEIVLACIKIGAVTVPCSDALPTAALEIRVAAVGAKVVIAEPAVVTELDPPAGTVTALSVDEARGLARRFPNECPTADTSGSDPALIVWTSGRTNGPRGATHTHQATFAARLHAEHWLDAGPGDVVWCSAPANSAQALWSSLFGPWARGAEIVLNEAPLDPTEEIELVGRLGVTTLCRTPGEYAFLAESDRLERVRSERLRRLVSTGNQLPDVLVEIVEERTGLLIHDGYGQAETGVIVGHGLEGEPLRGSIGRPLPGYEVAVVDGSGHELPPGHHGEIALRGTPPSLFAGYWNAPASTKSAFRGDWYVTGDVGTLDEAGFVWLAGRAGDVSPQPGNVPVVHRASGPVAVEAMPDAAASTVEPDVGGEVAATVVAVAPVETSWERHTEPVVPSVRPTSDRERLHTPLWARIIGAIWLLLLGILIGGAAIPHASDEPRITLLNGVPPSSICMPPSSRR